MAWNYRIIRKKEPYGFKNEYTYVYGVYEVYYSSITNKPHSWTEESIAPFSESEDKNCTNGKYELMQEFVLMQKAFEKPVLEIVEIDGDEVLLEVDE